MRWHDLLARALPRLRGNRMERELDEELRFHVELRTEENMRRGMAPEEARLAALRAFGGLEQAREDCRDARPGSRIEMFGRDLRYGVRALRRSPVFTCAAVITLALGIGALMSVFSLFDAALLQPLPYEGANRLLALNYSGTPYSVYPGGQIHVSSPGTWHLPYSQFQALKEQNHVLAGAGLYHTPQIAEARTGEISEQCLWASVTAGVFEALTTRPIRGRVFTAQEDRPGAPGTAVISAAFWRRRFNGREDVLGRQIVIQGNSYTIVGILPSSYRFPAGRTPDSNVEVWTPLRVDLGRSVQNWLFQMAATLKPGVTLAQAQEELRAIVARLNRENASSQRTPPTAPPTVTWYRDQVVGDYSSAFLILLAAGIFVMGIACANVANLFIIRAEKSRREQALRVVLGAGRGRLVAQNLAEALLVAAAGSFLGILLAWWSLDVMRSLAREMIPRLNEAAIGMEGLGLAVGVALAALAVMAVAPAMRVSGLSLQRELGASPMVAGQRGNRVRGVLVVVEFALALTLVFGAGLMIRSLQNLMGIGLGFNPDRVLTFTFTFPRGWYVPGRDEEFCDL
jgi:predicted permease